MSVRSVWKRAVSSAAVVAVMSAGIVSLPLSASAEDTPVASTASAFPETVSADALPTVQINGVVRDQAIVGNVVFAAGEFTKARPAGSPAGSNEVNRSNILAYTLSTGVLINNFAPTFNSTIAEVAVTPDGTRLFVVGNFTQVNGQTRNRVAVFDTATMALLPLAPNVNGPVDSVAVTNSTAYFGGNFTGVNGQPRGKFGGINISSGATLPVALAVDDGRVQGIAVSADGSRVVLSGSFTSIGGSNDPGYGLYMIDAATGAPLPMGVNKQVRNAGTSAGVTNLASDGVNFYGTGWHYGGGGSLEGTWAASWSTGEMVWIEDCHGDTYDVFSTGTLVYAASHKHYCGNSGGFPETNPRSYHHSTVTTVSAEGVNTPDIYGYPDNPGTPRPEILNWYPDTAVGSFTGSSQAVWSVTGNDKYIVYGGEFPNVNGTRQQGLVRYAVRSIAPNKEGPRLSAAGWGVTATSRSAGTVYVNIPTNWDRDDATLTYRVYRENENGQPILQRTATAQFWNGYTFTAIDRGLTPGASVRYRVTATDPSGNVAKTDWLTVTVSSEVVSAYTQSVYDTMPLSYWRMGESSGTAAADAVGTQPLTLRGTVTKNVAGALSGDNNRAMTFAGTTSSFASTTGTAVAGPTYFSTEAWIRTTSTRGGKIIGFGSSATGTSGSYDRHVYMSNNGELYFGVYPGSVKTVNTPDNDGVRYNDGQWHHVVATLGADGMKLYVDGALSGADATTKTAQAYTGYWRVGGDSVSGWTADPTSDYFGGSIDEVAVYGSALPAAAVEAHFTAGKTGATANQAPTAAFTATATDLAAAFDASGSTDIDGAVASYSWDFGDGTAPGTGATASHQYAAGGSYTVVLTVTDDKGATGTTSRVVVVSAPAPNVAPVAGFSVSPSFLAVSVDGAGSSDSDGSVVSYSWNFGDQSAAVSGPTASHTYAAAGTYSVTLTVTDDDGATGTLSKSVTVAAAPPAGANVLATDLFERAVSGGWGTADQGGAWALTGVASQFSVAGGAGNISAPASSSFTALLPTVSATNSLVTAEFSLDKIAVGQYVYLHGRRVGADAYSLRVLVEAGGAVRLHLFRGSVNIGSGYVVPGLTLEANQKYMVKLQVTGTAPTQLAGKLWKSGTTEPDWQKTASDTTAAMQSAGSVGVGTFIPGSAAGAASAPVAVSFHSLQYTDPTVPAP